MSEVKVNKISPRTACGTVTLGDSGDTFTIPSGATITNNGTQTGFGRTGTVDWDTTPKTGTVTAATGKGYFVNTTSGEITVNLPAGAAGSIVAVSDYASTANTNNILVEANGAELINADAGTYTISTNGLAVTLVYVDGTRGWKSVTGSDADATGVTATFIVGSVSGACNTLTTVSTDYKLAKFAGPGTFTVCSVGNPAGSTTVDYMIVAGGGGGGGTNNNGGYTSGGGGGAGGWRASSGTASGSYTAGPAPLTGPVSALTVTATGYPVVVGGGGSAGPGTGSGTQGSTSSFFCVASAGGGYGTNRGACNPGGPGGSGGGEAGAPAGCYTGGTGNTPPVSPPQGSNGGTNGGTANSGGGGGITAVGGEGTTPAAGDGGAGATTCITGSPVSFSGGG